MVDHTMYNCKTYNLKCKLICIRKVLDSNTFDGIIDLGFGKLKMERFSLIGIRTNSCNSNDVDDKIFGECSKSVLNDWCALSFSSPRDNVVMEIRYPEANFKDKYGNLLVELWIDEPSRGLTNINKWMIDNAHAIAYEADKTNNSIREFNYMNRVKLLFRHPDQFTREFAKKYLED